MGDMARLDNNHLSVFDLDKTLLTVNSSYAFSKFLYSRGVLSLKDRLYCLFTFFRFCLMRTSLDDLHHRVFNTLFKGRSRQDFLNQVEPFLNEVFESIINKKVIERLEKARSSQHTIILLSSSPSFLVGPIANRLNIPHWTSTEYQTDAKEKFSGISSLINGHEKAAKLIKMATDLNIPLSQTSAYSDSHEDLPLLSIAGIPIIVNPDRKLRRIANQKNWEIL